MRILMLGNSFTYYNDMPSILAELTGAEVVQHTRGGAFLFEHLDPENDLGKRTLPALAKESWDYVILQENSRGPIAFPEDFRKSVSALCSLIRENGAVPVLYATWAYKKHSEQMSHMPYSYEVMIARLYEAYHEAAEENDALIADVGEMFARKSEKLNLYDEFGFHPNPAGSILAAEIIASVIREDQAKRNQHPIP